jgi:hypothetical protein
LYTGFLNRFASGEGGIFFEAKTQHVSMMPNDQNAALWRKVASHQTHKQNTSTPEKES